MADRLAELADGLYGVPPADFIAERAARVKGLDDDPAVAARLKTLRKPVPAAWAVNLIARSRRNGASS